MKIVVDLDDAYPGNDRLPMLLAIRHEVPRFKATLFAIPGRCTPRWIETMLHHSDWLDIVPHGWTHATNRECERWEAQQAYDALEAAEHLGFTTKGFKAPGWQISDGCYEALEERGYWVADQTYNNARRPAGLRTYLLGAPPPDVHQIHGHIGHLNGHNANELEYLLPEIMWYRDSDFAFVREVVA